MRIALYGSLFSLLVLSLVWAFFRTGLSKPRQYRETVMAITKQSAARRAKQYYNMVCGLDVKPIKGNDDYDLFIEIIQDMIKEYDFAGLVELEKQLDKNAKEALWGQVGVATYRYPIAAPILSNILKEWAAENPGAWKLFQYQPNGIELLLRRAEDKEVPSMDREVAIWILAQMKAFDAVPRLRALTKDDTPISGPSQLQPLVSGNVRTVGKAAKEAVAKLESVRDRIEGTEHSKFREGMVLPNVP